MGKTAPSWAGLRNLLECQLVASGPVSASPSPTTQATIRSGLSKAAPKGELREEAFQAGLVRRNVGIDLAVRSLQVSIGDYPRSAVAGAGDVDHVQIMFFDDPVQMNVNEIQPRRRPPVAEQARLDMVQCQRLIQERVV